MEISSNNSGLYFGTRLGSNLKQYLKTYEFGECQYRMKKFDNKQNKHLYIKQRKELRLR